MASVCYIDYKGLKEFYTIAEVSQLLNMAKNTLREKCQRYGIEPRRNEIGDYGLVKYDIRKLHNYLYHEDDEVKSSSWRDDPWA